jgi:hypothetical protein
LSISNQHTRHEPHAIEWGNAIEEEAGEMIKHAEYVSLK